MVKDFQFFRPLAGNGILNKKGPAAPAADLNQGQGIFYV